MAVNKKTKKSKKVAGSDVSTDKKVEALLKKYGASSISYGLGTDSNVKRITSGVLGIDYILGMNLDGSGGAPMGRILEFYGPESSGKTALALFLLGRAQKSGQRCVLH